LSADRLIVNPALIASAMIVRDYDRIVAIDGLVRERDDIPAGVGGDELF
jgi:hypothetical protein